MTNRKDKRKKKKAGKPYSGIAAHKKQKKVLVPPLMAIPRIKLTSWVNDRLPEMLWCALLIYGLGRDHALAVFRKAAALVREFSTVKGMVDPTLSGFGSVEPEVREKYVSAICGDTETKNALRPLLLFEKLPAREHWTAIISQSTVPEDWECVKGAVSLVLNHQSQEATDCRWVRVLFHLLSGRLKLPTEEHDRQILEYPTFGMPQEVRPTVRAQEGLITQTSEGCAPWPLFFWNQCLRDTPCEARHTMETDVSPRIASTRAQVREVREALARHEKTCLTTTDVDAKHDAVFGLGAYSLAIIDELLWLGNSTSILGRLGLRTLLETYVTLSYLATVDDSQSWKTYRQYGYGQAKLAFLKLDDSTATSPTSVNTKILSQLANEDRWQEFVSINVGHWAERDLRKLSKKAGVKLDYDRFYPWTSAFTHGNWAAVRNSSFDLCINPVHRLHRILRPDTAILGDVVEDACELVDKTLAIIDGVYPRFTARVTLQRPQSISSTTGATVASETQIKHPPVAAIQKEFFEILNEFFRRATGVSAEEFAPMDSFGERISGEARDLGQRGAEAYSYAHQALGAFYRRFGLHILKEAKSLGGLKVVLGGTSRFGETQFDSVRKMLLYADSVLIPDPILPWIESRRREERFRNVLLLETAFVLLHLQPLVDTEFSSPLVLVVPSFEKSLEERDPQTQAEIGGLASRVLSHFLEQTFDGLYDLQSYVVDSETAFMQAVDKQALFVAPGGEVGQPLEEALEQYENDIKRWRSKGHQAMMASLPKGLLLLNGLIERFAPLYHLLENANGLSSCPLIPLRAPWHYYSLISQFLAEQLLLRGDIDAQTTAMLRSMNDPKRRWLGNIPITQLLELRLNKANEQFRMNLQQSVSKLHQASLKDLKGVVASVCREIVSLFAAHDEKILEIQEAYKSRYKDFTVKDCVTPAAAVLPALAPVVGLSDRWTSDEKQRDEPGRSLLGILAVPG